jgi:ribosome modulation factor
MATNGERAFEKGFKAAQQGKPASRNPHGILEQVYLRWQEGWNAGQPANEADFQKWLADSNDQAAQSTRRGTFMTMAARRYYSQHYRNFYR